MADFGKLNFAVSFNPQTAFPLDARYGNATEPPELRGDFLVCTKVSIGRN